MVGLHVWATLESYEVLGVFGTVHIILSGVHLPTNAAFRVVLR